MPTNEQLTHTRAGTHFFSPISAVQVRTTDPVAPESGWIIYAILTTASTIEMRVLFPGGTPQVIASST